MTKIILGKEVKDKVTGFKGIAICSTEWLHGCVRVSVQMKAKKGENPPELQVFDEPQLEVIGNGILPKPEKKGTHGDPNFKPSRAVAGK